MYDDTNEYRGRAVKAPGPAEAEALRDAMANLATGITHTFGAVAFLATVAKAIGADATGTSATIHFGTAEEAERFRASVAFLLKHGADPARNPAA